MTTKKYFEEVDNKDSEVDVPLSELLDNAILTSEYRMNIHAPATIVSYDHKKQTATVKPDFKKKYPDGTIEDSPQIFTVPILHPRSGAAFVHFPLKKGDKVTLMFADRSLDKWKSNGDEAFPDDTRTHHISDCWAIPGGYPLNSAATVSNANDLILKNGKMEVRIKKGGKIQLTNGGDELLKIIDDFMTAVIAGDQYGVIPIQQRLRRLLQR